MDLGAILLTVAVTILVGLFIARPFIEHRKNPSISNANHELSSLMAKREQYLEAIQELDFDFTMGKIPQEDYPTTRTNLVRKAAVVMKELDTLNNTGRSDAVLVNLIDNEVSAKRTQAYSTNDADIEDMLATRRSSRKERTSGFCPNCGKPVLSTDKFCPTCGKVQK